MPYLSPFLKFRMEGHFGASGTDKKEYWSAGLNIATPSVLAPGSSSILAFLTAVAPAVSAFHAGSTTKVGVNCFLDSLSGALIGTNGRYQGGSLQSTTRYTYPAAVAGVGSISAPWTQAVAWSMRSAILRGPGSHGRCYYPAPAAGIDGTTGTLNSTIQSNYLATVLILINAINAAATSGFATNTNVSNVSPFGTGFASPVTKVGIGARLDHQESREKSLSEAYVFGNTSVAARTLEEAERDYLEHLKTLPDYQDR